MAKSFARRVSLSISNAPSDVASPQASSAPGADQPAALQRQGAGASHARAVRPKSCPVFGRTALVSALGGNQ